MILIEREVVKAIEIASGKIEKRVVEWSVMSALLGSSELGVARDALNDVQRDGRKSQALLTDGVKVYSTGWISTRGIFIIGLSWFIQPSTR